MAPHEVGPDLMSPYHVDLMYEETIRSFLKRPLPVATGMWSGAQALGDTLVSFDPIKVYAALPRVADKLSAFKLMRTGLKLELRLNATRFHFGALLLHFRPMDSFRNPGAVPSTPENNALIGTMYPSVMAEASGSTVATLDIPYAHFLHMMEIGSTYFTLGRAVLTVLAPLDLVGATVSPEVSYTLYMSCIDPIVTGFTAADSLALEEQSLDSATRMVPESHNFLATTANDVACRGGITDDDVARDEAGIGFDRSDMLMSKIFTMPNPVVRFLWSSDQTIGTQLSFVHVAPSSRWSNTGTTHTYLSYLDSLHTLWTGSIRYRMKVFCSGFHTGRLLISWEPPVSTAPTSNVNETVMRNHAVLDIQDSTDYYFTIPYMSPVPWTECGGNVTRNGTVFINVLNTLASASLDVTEVSIIIWAYGSDSLQFAMPYVSSATPLPDSPPTVLEEQCLQMDLGDPSFVSLGGSYDLKPTACGAEVTKSVIDMVQKYGRFRSYLSSSTNRLSIYGINIGGDNTDGRANSTMADLQSMYVFHRGSVRYAAIMRRAENYTFPVDYTLGPDYSTTSSSVGTRRRYGFLLVQTETPNSMITVPFVSNRLAFVTRTTGLQPSPLQVTPQVAVSPLVLDPDVTTSPDSQAYAVAVFVAAGHDYGFSYLVPPQIG